MSPSSLSLSSRGSYNVLWRWSGQARSGSFNWFCPPLPGQVPVAPTETSNGRTAQGAMEASPVNKISTVWTRRTSMAHMMGERGASGLSTSRRAAVSQTAGQEIWRPCSEERDQDPLPDLTQTQSQELPRHSAALSLSEISVSVSTGQGDGKRTQQSGSQQGSDDGHPSTSSSSKRSCMEKPTECRKRNRVRSFLQRLWKAVKSPFCCCCLSSAVDEESFTSLYDLGGMIGSGGFGRVYKGTRKFDGKKVAIKQINKIENNRYLYIPGYPKPLVTEVALMLMMRREPISPLIIQLYEWFEHPLTFNLVMEFPEPCMTLLDYIVRKPVLDEPTGRFIMRQALLALQICIEHGVFHNDPHAQNFLIKENTLELKLIDFGCGQLFSRDGYESNTYVGVMYYCPPEVSTEPRFHAVPANVWALGVLLYTMVHSGCPPFLNRTEIRRANLSFTNYSLSKGNNMLAVLGGGLDLET